MSTRGINNTKNTNANVEQLGKGLMNTKPLIITGTTAMTNVDAYAIYALEDTAFTTLNYIGEGDDLSAETLSAGHIWYVPIKGTVQLTSGAVIVYQNKKSDN